MESDNRLGREASPYLLQHRADPVAWWPWCDEAFEEARRRDVPVLISIGYSTCHWCHVMARESFQSKEIADVLNAHFVSIKVDREERPDVDELYMNAVQLMNQGQGGWPMTVFAEGEQRHPFFAGTYYAPHDLPGRPSFLTLLRAIHEAWGERRSQLLEQGGHVAQAVTSMQEPTAIAEAEPESDLQTAAEAMIVQASHDLMRVYDTVHGGFGRGPNKFPTPPQPALLIDCMWSDAAVRGAVIHSFERMVLGGMHDQIGGGFHRYSTDPQWLVPHFEKMLYDTAQMLPLLAELSVRTEEDCETGLFAFAARRCVQWIEREMTAPDGAFHAAIDADVDHREGLATLWTPDLIAEALDAQGLAGEAQRVLRFYAVDAAPNFRDPHDDRADAMWIPHLTDRPETVFERIGGALEAGESWVAWRDRIDSALLAARRARPEPLRDDKIVTAWNGLMIEGLARAGRLLAQPAWIRSAERAAEAALAHVVREDGRVARVRYGSVVRPEGFLDDAAALGGGLLALHQATESPRWLEAARRIALSADTRFRTPAGGWYDADADARDLFARPRSMHDGAVPSGTGQMTLLCAGLFAATGDASFAELVRGACTAQWRTLSEHPAGLPCALRAMRMIGGAA